MAYRFRGLGQSRVSSSPMVYVPATTFTDPVTGQTRTIEPAHWEPGPGGGEIRAPSPTTQTATQVPTQTVIVTPTQITTPTVQVAGGAITGAPAIQTPVTTPVASPVITAPGQPAAPATQPVTDTILALAQLLGNRPPSEPPTGSGGAAPPTMQIIPLPEAGGPEERPTVSAPAPGGAPTPALAGIPAIAWLAIAGAGLLLFRGGKR